MKKLVIIACLLMFGLTQAQKVVPTYEIIGELVKVTYYHDNGKVKQKGYFKNKKLEGVWTTLDVQGNKIAIAKYHEGVKIGKWKYWTKDGVNEITYQDNKVKNKVFRKIDTKLASK